MDRTLVINLLLTFMVLLAGCAWVLLHFSRNTKNKAGMTKIELDEQFEIPYLIEYVKEYINEATRTNLYELGLDSQEIKKRLNKRSELKKALKNCSYGSLEDKMYVKDYLIDILLQDYLTRQNIDQVIPFNNDILLTVQDKFEILIHLFKKKHGPNAFAEMIGKYNLDEGRKVEGEEGAVYSINKQDIERIFRKEAIHLEFEDKLQIIAQRIYQYYKGFGVVDEIRDLNIDGVSGGVSGLTGNVDAVYEGLATKEKYIPRNYDSVWVFYRGKTIHLEFLSFGSEKELRRICQNIYRYNKAGQLSEKTGYKVNDMKDGSRVVVVRPGFSESWAFFVRKFHIANVSLERLIKEDQSTLAVDMIRYLAKGCRVTALTGSQGCGKTTLLMAFVRHIYPSLPLRVQEMSFELNLRKVYPKRNILTFRETEHIKGQAGLDLQKKTDGAVNILGEVATDEVAAWMIQAAQVASLFTVFTHHAKTAHDLIMSLRNSLLKSEMFSNEKAAEEQVVSVLNFDIHLNKDYKGVRYIERITELIPLHQRGYATDYQQAGDLHQQMSLMMDVTRDYYTRQTDRELFVARDVIRFRKYTQDEQQQLTSKSIGVYEVGEPISRNNVEAMLSHMTHEDQNLFIGFLKAQWKEAYCDLYC